jgi:hypothetical protein
VAPPSLSKSWALMASSTSTTQQTVHTHVLSMLVQMHTLLPLPPLFLLLPRLLSRAQRGSALNSPSRQCVTRSLFDPPHTSPHLTQNKIGANLFYEPLPLRPPQFGVSDFPFTRLCLSVSHILPRPNIIPAPQASCM